VSPEGLDVKNYTWGVFQWTVADDGATHTAQPKLNPTGGSAVPTSWLITRVQAFANATQVGPFFLVGFAPSQGVQVLAGGCIELLPGGAFRNNLFASGGGQIIVEYWYPAGVRGLTPEIVTT
jgi:hypothetical protein